MILFLLKTWLVIIIIFYIFIRMIDMTMYVFDIDTDFDVVSSIVMSIIIVIIFTSLFKIMKVGKTEKTEKTDEEKKCFIATKNYIEELEKENKNLRRMIPAPKKFVDFDLDMYKKGILINDTEEEVLIEPHMEEKKEEKVLIEPHMEEKKEEPHIEENEEEILISDMEKETN